VVLVVDDMAANRALLARILARDGHSTVTVSNAAEALERVAAVKPDVVLADVVMPGMNGIELCRALKADPAGRLTPVVLVTSLHGRDERITGIEAGADDFIVKPFDPEELRARVRSLVRLKRSTDDLDSADAVIMSLAMTVEARDPCTQGHCERLARWAVGLGRRLGLNEAQLAALERGGVLHDIGKVAVPDSILLKPGPLTAAEMAQMQQHTLIGDRLCSELRLLQSVRPIVRSHHERLDGSGYPDGLRGPQVPLLAQIISVVDVFDALTTARPYKPAFQPDVAVRELYAEARRGWRDERLVAEFAAFYTETLPTRAVAHGAHAAAGTGESPNGGLLPAGAEALSLCSSISIFPADQRAGAIATPTRLRRASEG
jgi:putative two-component system response regulator